MAVVLDNSWAEDLDMLMKYRENFKKIDGIFKRDGTKDCIDTARELA